MKVKEVFINYFRHYYFSEVCLNVEHSNMLIPPEIGFQNINKNRALFYIVGNLRLI